jgi:hypothetical protein
LSEDESPWYRVVMSDRESTLSFNLVDWKIREQILAATRNQLESLLCALELPPATDDDRHAVKRLDEGGVPEIVHPYFVWHGLRVDQRRFAMRAVELYEQSFMRNKLEELAFVGGSTRSFGDLWLIDSDVVLCCCDSDYARCRSEALDEFTTDAPTFVEFAGAHVMTRAMGGLSPEIEPLDQAYDPTAAAELAAALDVFSIDSIVVPPRVRYLAERGALGHFRQSLRQLRSTLGIDDEGPLVGRWDAESLGTVEEFVRRSAGEIRAIYAQARARGLGVDVYWHGRR